MIPFLTRTGLRRERLRTRGPGLLSGLLLSLLSPLLSGCGGAEPVEDAKSGRMVYFDTASKQPLVAEVASSFPAPHPETGRPTLQPALYCPGCGSWHPVPPVDQLNRSSGAGRCPKTGAVLTTDGPWPDETPGTGASDTVPGDQ